MEIYTIGYAKKSASEFFGQLRAAGIRRLLDIRLNNTSQLAGFTKMGDFPFFLKEICAVTYQHLPALAPAEEILSSYRDKKIQWSEMESRYLTLLSERRIEDALDRKLFEVPRCFFAARRIRSSAIEGLRQSIWPQNGMMSESSTCEMT